MHLWFQAWMVIFMTSTIAFAVIAGVVIVLGAKDLKVMLQGLSQDRNNQADR
jgi:hypothetical protein